MDWGKPDDPLRNPKDPLHNTAPTSGRELFKRVSKIMDGFPHEAAMDAGFNMIFAAIRQGSSSWFTAEAAWDDKVGRAKQILRDHYDQNGKRRNVFPAHQIIDMPHFDARDKH